MQQSIEFKLFGLLFYSYLLICFQYVCRDLQIIYDRDYRIRYELRNVVLPLRLLLKQTLMRDELCQDEVAATLSTIYFETFPRAAR